MKKESVISRPILGLILTKSMTRSRKITGPFPKLKTNSIYLHFISVVAKKFGLMTPEFVADGFIKLVTRGVVSNSFHDRTSQQFLGSIGIAPTRDCTHFNKILFVVAGAGFIPMGIN